MIANPNVDALHIVARLTPKALRVEQLRSAGMKFNDALAQADQEYSENGWSMRPQQSSVAELDSIQEEQYGETQP